MEHIKKINIIIIILLVIGLLFSNYSQASEIVDIFSDADEFLEKGDPVSSTINETNLKSTSSFMYKLLLAIGIVVMFIVGTILGIQFMLASAEEKAKVKEALIPYIVGCFVIFGAFTIWSTVVNIGQDITGKGGAIGSTTYTIKTLCRENHCSLTQEDIDFMKSTHECRNCQTETDYASYIVCDNCGEKLLCSIAEYTNCERCDGCGLYFSD